MPIVQKLSISSPLLMNRIKGWRQEQQCLLCKKRRVRCDYSKPSCKRCERDNIECPGYVRIRNWQGSGTRQGTLRVDQCKVNKNVQLDSEPKEQTAISELIHDGQEGLLLSLHRLSLEKEDNLVLECWKYFNGELVPSVWPAHKPFHRQSFQLPDWCLLPPIIQHLLIIHVRTSQSVKTSTDPSANDQIYHYRGLCLAGLKNMIFNAKAVSDVSGSFDPDGLILFSVVIFMFTDLQAPPSGSSIDYHLNATRRIIALRGGFLQCWQDMPVQRGMLLSYLVIDVFRATTRDVQSIDALALEQQLSYISFITFRDDEIKRTAYVCPNSIMQAIINTTILRVATQSETLKPKVDPKNFTTILESIESFDPAWWADNVASYGHIHPQKAKDCASRESIAAWTALGICFKCAALLYLRVSCPQPGNPDNGSIRCAKQTLSSYIHYLLQTGTENPEDAVEHQLWKFLGWPITMSVFVRISGKIGQDSAEDELEYVRRSAKIMGVRSFCGFFDDFGLFDELESLGQRMRL